VSDPLLKNDEKRIKHRKATLKCCPATGGRRQHFRLPKKNTAGNGCFNLAAPADPAVAISIMRTNRTRSADPKICLPNSTPLQRFKPQKASLFALW
jgi:hypothetical protein